MNPKDLFVEFYNEAIEKYAAEGNPATTFNYGPSEASTITPNVSPKVKKKTDWMKNLQQKPVAKVPSAGQV
jgi:hypothetical protein